MEISENSTCCFNCQYFLLGEETDIFFDAEKRKDQEEWLGECHYNAPYPFKECYRHSGMSYMGQWPLVNRTSWCAKFTPRKPGVIRF